MDNQPEDTGMHRQGEVAASSPGEVSPGLRDVADADREILRQRAIALAVSDGPYKATPGETLEIITFEFGDQQFAVERQYVVQVKLSGEVVPVPHTPDTLVGLVNLRGKILPVYNLLRILQYSQQGIADSHQIIHLESEGVEICLLADKTGGVASVPLDTLQLSTDSADGFIKGITPDHRVLIDAAAILCNSSLVINHSVI